jgi:hypothetical protein
MAGDREPTTNENKCFTRKLSVSTPNCTPSVKGLGYHLQRESRRVAEHSSVANFTLRPTAHDELKLSVEAILHGGDVNRFEMWRGSYRDRIPFADKLEFVGLPTDIARATTSRAIQIRDRQQLEDLGMELISRSGRP